MSTISALRLEIYLNFKLTVLERDVSNLIGIPCVAKINGRANITTGPQRAITIGVDIIKYCQ